MTLVTTFFLPLAQAIAKGRGIPDLPLAVVPHPYDTLPDAELLQIADRILPSVVEAVCQVKAKPAVRG
ncbi:MAG: hypothetical protein HYX92_08285 [Chloroflexi bacterium]|nr:hypothetical protein [Chloroflexota bacterium]